MMRLSTTIFAALCTLILASAPATAAQGTQAAAGARDTQVKRNMAVARRVYEEGLSQGVFTVPYTKDFIGHGSGTTTFTHEQGIAEARGWRLAFPDLKVVVDLIVADRDLVSVRWTARGTNTGSGNGIPATGKRAEVSGTTIFRLVDGAIAEEWTAGDALGLMKQLGLLPAAGTGATDKKGAT